MLVAKRAIGKNVNVVNSRLSACRRSRPGNSLRFTIHGMQMRFKSRSPVRKASTRADA